MYKLIVYCIYTNNVSSTKKYLRKILQRLAEMDPSHVFRVVRESNLPDTFSAVLQRAMDGGAGGQPGTPDNEDDRLYGQVYSTTGLFIR